MELNQWSESHCFVFFVLWDKQIFFGLVHHFYFILLDPEMANRRIIHMYQMNGEVRGKITYYFFEKWNKCFKQK